MDADPEQTPEERLKIMFKTVLLTKECIDSHENFCTCHTSCF